MQLCDRHMILVNAHRRRPQERSYRERKEARAGYGPAYALDVAGIDGIYFCTVPEGAAARGGEVVPFFLVRWMEYIDFTQHMQVERGGDTLRVLRAAGSIHMSPQRNPIHFIGEQGGAGQPQSLCADAGGVGGGGRGA